MEITRLILKPGLLTLLLLVALTFPARPQAPDWQWVKSAGGSGVDEGMCVTTDIHGDIYVAGNFFSPLLTINSIILSIDDTTIYNNSNIFFLKYSPSGNILWGKSFGKNCKVTGITTDGYENIYMTGYFRYSQIIFDSTILFSSGSTDIFLVKFSPEGNVIWAKSAGGNANDISTSIASDTNGNVYLTGFFESSTINFGTSNFVLLGYQDIFLVKYSPDGDVLWAKTAKEADNGMGLDITTDSLSNVFITGVFTTTLNFDTVTVTSSGYGDIFLAKFNTNGNIMWAKSYGVQWGAEEGNSLRTDKKGNLYLAGIFKFNISFGDISLTSSGDYDIFLVKFSSEGNALWAQQAGGDNTDKINRISIDPVGNVYMTGSFMSINSKFGTLNLNNTCDCNNRSDIFLAKYSSEGNLLLLKSAEGKEDSENSNSVVSDNSGNILLTGTFYSSSLAFDNIILKNTGVSDFFLAKLKKTNVIGYIYKDFNNDCIKDTNEIFDIPGFTLLINPGNLITQANSAGVWYLDSLPAGNYSVTAHPTGKWKLTCPETQNFTVTDPNAFTVAPAFGFVSTEPCPEPDVSVNAPFLRRCFSNQNIYVNACNKTTATGALNNAYVVLELDSSLIPQSFSTPYIDLGNNTFRFDIGNLNPGMCTNFSVACSLSCSAMMGQTLCMKANLFPADSCIFDTITNIPTGVSPCILPWDKSSLKVEGSCVDDTIGFKAIRFVVYNTGKAGEGDMQCYSPVRIYVDAQMFKLDSVKLNGGDSAMFVFAGDGRTWRLEADQHPKHPGHSHPNATIEACGETINWTPGLVNALPMDDADPVVDIYCGTVTTSYDPNDKAGYPAGIGENNDIMPNQKIEYVIRFQNTGNDTAFTIVVRDTLNMALDIFSVTSGASSHNYSFRMYGPRILEWTFNNILLPDSNVNEPGSHGFVTFSINQISALSNETKIKNTADIYFDFNAPVRTNTVTHTVQDNVQNITVTSEKINLTKANTIKIYPNPAGGKLLVEIPVNHTASVTISIHDLVGKKLMQWKETVTLNYKKEIDLRSLPVGVYFLKVQGGEGMEVRKVVVY